MKNKNKVANILSLIAHLSILVAVLSICISIAMKDLRPIGIGLILFGLGYFSSFIYVTMYRKMISLAILFAIPMLLVVSFGLSVFLHHYDIDWLLNAFQQCTKWINKNF